MSERVLHAAAHRAVHAILHIVRQQPADDDAAKRDRSAGLAFPELAEIDDLLQSLCVVGEPVLVDDQPRVVFPVQQRRLDRRKHQLRFVPRVRKCQAEQETGGRVFPGNRDPEPPRRYFFLRDRSPGNEQRAAIASKRAAGIEQHITAGAVGVRVVAELGHLGLSLQGRRVELFNVRKVHGELEAFQIDTAVHDRVEHEAIVRAR